MRIINPRILLLWTAVLCVLTSCESTPKSEKKAKPLAPVSVKIDPPNSVIDEKQTHKIKEEMVNPLPYEAELAHRVDLKLQERKEEKTPVRTDDALRRLFGDKSKKENAVKMKVALNFDGASLTDVIPAFAQALNFNYMLDSNVKGNVTISVDADMSRLESWELFSQILWMSGAYAVYEDGVIRIRPVKDLPQERHLFRQEHGSVEALVYPLKYAQAKDLAAQIKPFMSDSASLVDLAGRNALLIVETPEIMKKVCNLINMLDIPERSNWHRSVIQCRNIPASKIRGELEEVLPLLGFPVVTSDGKKGTESGAIQLVDLERLQVILASAPTEEVLKEVRHWVEVLDRADSGEQERVFIYKVINSKAEDLLQALSVIFNTEGVTLSAPKGDSGSSSTSSKNASNSSTRSSSSKSTATRKNSKETPTSVFEVPVKIFADGVHNRLVIRTSPRTYAMAKALLQRLDTVAAQVLLQVLVVEVTLSDSTQFGLEFSGLASGSSVSSIFGTNYKGLQATDDSSVYGGKYYIYNPQNPDEKFAYIRALAGRSRTKVISSPQVLVVSHSTAKISVGDKVPIVSSEITDTSSTSSDSTVLKRNIQYQDTGIILTVTPHVTKGGLVTMELEQTVSETVASKDNDEIDSPTIQERVLKTSMSLRDGRTLIIGGLIKEKVAESLSSLPYLINIPIIGDLLGYSDNSIVRTEMLILITANIIGEETKLDQLVRRYRRAVTQINNFQNSFDEKMKIEEDIEKQKERKEWYGL